MLRLPRAIRSRRDPRPSREPAPGALWGRRTAALRTAAASAALAWLAACGAARPPASRPYPTLEQYSDGASTLVAAVSSALYARDKTALERLWPQGGTARLATA